LQILPVEQIKDGALAKSFPRVLSVRQMVRMS
jgi:hypothetical protein